MSSSRTIAFPSDRKPDRIDRFLAVSFPELSRSQIKHLIINGSVFCNSLPVTKPSHKAVPGDNLVITFPEPEAMAIEPEDIPLEILYQDVDVAVINKPAGMIVHPVGKIVSGTLVNALLFHLDDLSGINGVLRPGIVHRLDKDTSGVMIIAKNDRSHRDIGTQFETRTIEKTYRALVWGIFAVQSGEISKPIARSRSDRKKMVSGTRGRESKTRYTVFEEFSFLSLLDVYPKTGRTHQIRSHFASIGHPVFGDALYRGRNRRLTHLTVSDRNQAVQLLKMMLRHALHAVEIAFVHPSSRQSMRFSAPLPPDFSALIEILHNSAEALRNM